jgi:hypothetical protein
MTQETIPMSAPLASRRSAATTLLSLAAGFVALGALVATDLRDFLLSGTQAGDVGPDKIFDSSGCSPCHGSYDPDNSPFDTWEGSLMAQAGRDPLFFAQMTTANQDVQDVGYFCMRCHVPMSFVTGHAYATNGSLLDDTDRDGVTCHFCHSMVDPIYKPGVSPIEDMAVLSKLKKLPQHYGNAMFVLDQNGLRRGPYTNASQSHATIYSPFHESGSLCGTCHDVGNVAVSRQPDGTYAYNQLGKKVLDEDLHAQFPLERTYTEWKLSEFAKNGVDMGGLFGGTGDPVVSSCQDCHMPKTEAQGCLIGPLRDDLARHDFAGASAWVLEIIGVDGKNDPNVNQAALAIGRQKATEMVQKAAALRLNVKQGKLGIRVINQTGHKLPTGHIEGRRVFLNIKFFDAQGQIVREHGHYDSATAHLDEASTVVYEMKVGLSAQAAASTGLPSGVTTHMALADTIEKDNRIPPRGFSNQAFEAAGAPVVGAVYADGHFWDDVLFDIPLGAVRAKATVYYQTVTAHYIEALRDANYTDDWGKTLHRLWVATNRCPPIEITSGEILIP